MKRWIFPTLVLITIVFVMPHEFFAQSRELRVVSTRGALGQTVVVTIEMVATGNENAAGFSLNYDPRVLTNPQVSSGNGIAGATLSANTANAAAGSVGVILGLPANQTFSAGIHQVALVSFEIAPGGSPGVASLTFGDRPVVREVVDAAAVPLATAFTNGSIQLISPLTLTVAPTEPSTLDEIVIEARGVWNDGCVPANPVVARDGATVTLTTTAVATVCLQALTPVVLTVPIGKLPRGVFTVSLIHRATPSTIRLGSVSLVVKGGLVNTNASSYRTDSLAPDSIVAAFGADLATTTTAVATLPLPLSLAGTTVRIRDAAGIETMAPLFFVSPLQVNYHLPAGVAPGRAIVSIINGQGVVSSGSVMIARVSPGLFTLDGSGRGLVAAYIQRNSSNGQVSYEQVWRLDSGGTLVSQAVELGAQNDQLFLVLYGTGFRSRSALGGVTVNIGGLPAEVLFAGGIQDYVGLDQCNVRLDRRLVGRGLVEIELIVDGQAANRVTVAIR